ncbi:PIH1 domain-containing protein 3 [Kipferlia bialata]|uniref:PIH1 domain-containing protein 3 n=1 Tax=Kipferlia bialata TaxID=797122 RepID=A0A391NZ74_9EUKA|nr:PIH1 domain-containing protein 3 [Kipferlia bialata]|eukprot:g11317.t1
MASNPMDLAALADLLQPRPAPKKVAPAPKPELQPAAKARALRERQQEEQAEREREAAAAAEAEKKEAEAAVAFGEGFKAPKYDILYQQDVSPQEVYGGFQQMSPSLADSQFLILRVQLPDEKVSDVDVDAKESQVTLFAKHHRLQV